MGLSVQNWARNEINAFIDDVLDYPEEKDAKHLPNIERLLSEEKNIAKQKINKIALQLKKEKKEMGTISHQIFEINEMIETINNLPNTFQNQLKIAKLKVEMIKKQKSIEDKRNTIDTLSGKLNKLQRQIYLSKNATYELEEEEIVATLKEDPSSLDWNTVNKVATLYWTLPNGRVEEEKVSLSED